MTNIFNEIDEDIRKEKYQIIWKKYGKYLIALIILIILSFSTVQLYESNSVLKNKNILELYINASEEIEKNQINDAVDKLDDVYFSSNKALAAFSKFKLSELYIKNGENKKAQDELKILYKDSSIENLYRELALYKYLLIRLDNIHIDEIIIELESLTIDKKVLDSYFQEIIAIKYLILNEKSEAKKILKSLLSQDEIPIELRVRLEKLTLIAEK